MVVKFGDPTFTFCHVFIKNSKPRRMGKTKVGKTQVARTLPPAQYHDITRIVSRQYYLDFTVHGTRAWDFQNYENPRGASIEVHIIVS